MRNAALAILLTVSMLAVAADEPKKSDSGTLTVTIKTNRGDIVGELYGKRAPLTVANFVNLARRGYYNGLKFHRVIKNFMIQGGCPFGTGFGGPGYSFENEFHQELRHSGPGIFSMANTGRPKSNGSQFFTTHRATKHLDNKHSVFGKVIKGQDVVNKIQQNDVMKEVVIAGPVTPAVKKYQKRIDEFNKALDREFPKLKKAEKL